MSTSGAGRRLCRTGIPEPKTSENGAGAQRFRQVGQCYRCKAWRGCQQSKSPAWSPSRGVPWAPYRFSYSNDSGMIGDKILSFSRSQNDESGSSSSTVSRPSAWLTHSSPLPSAERRTR